MRAEKNGVKVKYTPNGQEAQNGDLYKCPVCGNEIITGFGTKYLDHNPSRYDYVRNVVY
jgi:hypothetical protein